MRASICTVATALTPTNDKNKQIYICVPNVLWLAYIGAHYASMNCMKRTTVLKKTTMCHHVSVVKEDVLKFTQILKPLQLNIKKNQQAEVAVIIQNI